MRDRIQSRENCRAAIGLYPELHIPQPFKWSNISMFQQFPWVHEHSIFSQRWKETSGLYLRHEMVLKTPLEVGLHSRGTETADWDAGPGPTKRPDNNPVLGETTYSNKAPQALSKLEESTPQKKPKLWIPACSRQVRSARKWGKRREWENVQPEVALARSATSNVMNSFQKTAWD